MSEITDEMVEAEAAKIAPSDAEIAEVVALLRSWNEPLDHRAANLILTLQQRALQSQPSAPAGGEVAELLKQAADTIHGAMFKTRFISYASDADRALVANLYDAFENLKTRSGEEADAAEQYRVVMKEGGE